MKKVVFVCTGNTCRSPMAEGLFRKYIKNRKIKGVEVSSVGLYCSDGDEPSENAVKAAQQLGADISSHRSRRLSDYDFNGDTYFVCMTVSHKQTLQLMKSDIKVMSIDIPDPFGQDLSVYLKTAQAMTERFNDIIDFVTAQYEIVPMTVNDVKQVAEIEKECFSIPWSEKSLYEELDNEVARFFVAKTFNKVVGYIGAFNVCGEVSITNVAVKRGYHGRGIATMLIKHLLFLSKDENAQYVTLEVRQSNETARRLYERNGFMTVGQRKNFYQNPKEDAVLMTKYF